MVFHLAVSLQIGVISTDSTLREGQCVFKRTRRTRRKRRKRRKRNPEKYWMTAWNS
jgi:hypothetical protein